MPHDDIRDLDSSAVRASVVLVSKVTASDLGKPTPCPAWTLGELIAHMTVQHRGFAAAAAGHGSDPEAWRPGPPASDPAAGYAGYAEAAGQVLTAFAADGVLDRPFALPEITTAMTFPGRQAIAFHLVDYVVHSWDVGRAIGLQPDLEPAVLAVALKVAEAVPGGAARLAPGAAFGPVLAAPDQAGPLDRILTLLGRSPAWPA
jgi:uncharacterized protein (TIGR03086 family)